MLVRISLFVAILLGIGATVLNVVQLKDKITTLRTDRDTEKAAHQEFEGKYRQTKSDLDKTNAVLKTTQETLKATEEAKEKALADAAAQQKRADKLNDDLTKTRTERDDAQQKLASYVASGLSPLQAANANKEIKSLQTALSEQQVVNRSLDQKVTRLQSELDVFTKPDKHVELRADLKGKVLVSDPKWNFVVLNVGEEQGVLKYGELLVNRNGKLVAKVKVSTVQKDRSVANVMPGWQLGEVMEGDMVIPAYPAS